MVPWWLCRRLSFGLFLFPPITAKYGGVTGRPDTMCPRPNFLGLNPWWILSLFWGVKTCFYVGGDVETGFVQQSHWSETCQTTLDAPCFI